MQDYIIKRNGKIINTANCIITNNYSWINGRQSLFIEAHSDKIEGIITLHDRLKISGVEIRLRTLGQKLGINKVHPYKFRRMAATKAIDKGMSIYLASFIWFKLCF